MNACNDIPRSEGKMDDSKIVDLYLARDESAIKETRQKYGKRLLRIADHILHDREDAEECEADTCLYAWNNIPPHTPRDYLFAFLGCITRHLAIDRCRKKEAGKRAADFVELTREMEECIAGHENAEEKAEAKELGWLIDGWLESCSPEKRKVFVRRYWYMDPVSDMCRSFGISRAKADTMLHRMREELRTFLEKEGYWI